MVTVHSERPADVDAVRGVVARAFAAHTAVAELVDRIRASPRHVPEYTLVARAGDDVVGFVALSWTDLRGADDTLRPVLSLSPLAVDPPHQGSGIGGRLVREVVARADAGGETLVVLEGSPRYYPRFGFRPAVDFGVHIDLPDWAPPEAAQVRPLTAYDPTLRGTLVYPPAFDGI